MVTRQYKWEDLEELRKFFKMSLEDVAKEVKTTRQTLYSAMKGSHSTNPEYKSEFWALHVGMAWEIFAIQYCQCFKATQKMDPHDCYNYLLWYIRSGSKLRFDEWYMEED